MQPQIHSPLYNGTENLLYNPEESWFLHNISLQRYSSNHLALADSVQQLRPFQFCCSSRDPV
jgi:hypothetical protein